MAFRPSISELPTISVMMPSYNHGAFLQAAINSVLSQRYPKLEFMIFDGGSTDGSAGIIQSYADRLAYWISQSDGGQVNALNQGLARATGDVIGWLNSDDLYTDGTLARVGRYFAEHPDIMLLHGDCLMVDEHDAI